MGRASGHHHCNRDQGPLRDRTYPQGFEVFEKEMALVNFRPDKLHSGWNCEIRPRELRPERIGYPVSAE